MDALSIDDPLVCLDLRDAHAEYAALLHQWDKHSQDAKNQETSSRNANDALTEGWRDKSSICSGIWLITPGGFALQQ